MEKYTCKEFPAVTTLCKGYVNCNYLYTTSMNKIRNVIISKKKKKLVLFNEFTDSLGWYIANVVIGILKTDGPGLTFLLNLEILIEANHLTIAKLFDQSKHILCSEGVRHMMTFYYIEPMGFLFKQIYSNCLFKNYLCHFYCLWASP